MNDFVSSVSVELLILVSARQETLNVLRLCAKITKPFSGIRNNGREHCLGKSTIQTSRERNVSQASQVTACSVRGKIGGSVSTEY